MHLRIVWVLMFLLVIWFFARSLLYLRDTKLNVCHPFRVFIRLPPKRCVKKYESLDVRLNCKLSFEEADNEIFSNENLACVRHFRYGPKVCYLLGWKCLRTWGVQRVPCTVHEQWHHPFPAPGSWVPLWEPEGRMRPELHVEVVDEVPHGVPLREELQELGLAEAVVLRDT